MALNLPGLGKDGGAMVDTNIETGTKAAMKAAGTGDIEGVFEASGISAKTNISSGAMAAALSAQNDSAKGAANK